MLTQLLFIAVACVSDVEARRRRRGGRGGGRKPRPAPAPGAAPRPRPPSKKVERECAAHSANKADCLAHTDDANKNLCWFIEGHDHFITIPSIAPYTNTRGGNCKALDACTKHGGAKDACEADEHCKFDGVDITGLCRLKEGHEYRL